MIPRPLQLGTVKLKYDDYPNPITVLGVVAYPALPETEIDPPEAAWAEWDAIFLGGETVDCHHLLSETVTDWIEHKILRDAGLE